LYGKFQAEDEVAETTRGPSPPDSAEKL
jgi:hypothetical protein